jgi:hypothetical protein
MNNTRNEIPVWKIRQSGPYVAHLQGRKLTIFDIVLLAVSIYVLHWKLIAKYNKNTWKYKRRGDRKTCAGRPLLQETAEGRA